MIEIPIAIVAGLFAGWCYARTVKVHYRRRWIESVKLIDELTKEKEQEQIASVSMPAPSRLDTNLVRAYGTPSQSQHGGDHSVNIQAGHDIHVGESWKVSARTIRGVTTVLLKNGTDVEGFDSVSQSASGYSDKLYSIVRRANKVAALRNAQ